MGSIAGLPNQLCRLVLAGWLTLAGAANIDTRLRGDVDPTGNIQFVFPFRIMLAAASLTRVPVCLRGRGAC